MVRVVTTKMADNFPWSSSLNTFTDVFSEPSSPNSSRTAQKEPIVHSENLYHADLGSQNDGNSSTREPLREMNDNNTSPDCSAATAWGKSLKSMPPFGENYSIIDRWFMMIWSFDCSVRSATSPTATTPSMLSSTKVILGISFVARGIFISWSTRSNSSFSVPGSS